MNKRILEDCWNFVVANETKDFNFKRKASKMEKAIETVKGIAAFLQGKKTYIIAALIAVLGFFEGTGIFHVPAEIWPVLGAVALGSVRAGVKKTEKAIKEAQNDKV